MKADNNNSQEKIRKATELLQKSWWFSWFLIIAPLTTAIVGFFIFRLFRIEFYLALSFAVVVFMFALLLFYKAFDKYRNNPFFLDKTNNLKARIHIIFLISTLAFIATPIFILISPVGYSFITLPLISYVLLYNIVYYYCYFQPLDFYDLNEGEFKHAQDFKLILKQPYNFLLFLNYIIHIIFLSITASTNFSWLYSLITNLFIYFITITSTKKQISEIDVLILEKKSFLKELTLYKLKLTISLINLIFILLIQLPFIVLITSILSGTHYSNIELVNSFFLSLIFILFYFKSRFYISFYYTSRLTVYEEAEKLKDVQERPPFLSNKYQKYNSYFSGLLILLIMLFSFLINIPVLILFILPFLYILFHYEQKSDLCSKKYNKYIILLNSFVILISICFGLLPQISEIFYINIQFISFLFLSYFALQLFAKFGYFNKDNIIIYQNIIGVSCFSIILYSFFPIVIFEYISFTSDPFIIFISNFLVHSILILIILLISFYVLYIRFFYAKRPKLFKVSVVANIFVIELILFILINLRIFYLVELFTFFQILILSTILFPLIFIIFVSINYFMGILPLKSFLLLTYYSFWMLILTVFLSISLTFFNNYIIITLDLLLLSILLHYNIKFGLNLDKITAKTFKKFVKVNSYLLTFELFFLFYNIFFVAFQALLLFDNIIYSTYLSLAIICTLINLFSKREIFSEALYIKINVFILLYSSIITFYFFLLLTLNTFYVLIIPILTSSIVLYIPILYLRKKKLCSNLTPKLLTFNSILLSITLALIPTIIGLDLFYLGIYFDLTFLIITIINFTLYILFLIFAIINYLSRKIKIREERLKFFLKFQLLTVFCTSATTIFYYPYFLLSETLYAIVFPLIFVCCFLYFPLYYSYKKSFFNIEDVKRIIILNTIILSCLLTTIPTLVGINFIYLGVIFDFNMFLLNILNFSIYIFYLFLLIISSLLKKFKIKENFILIVNQVHIIFLFIISITTVFFYPFLVLLESYYGIILPLIALLFSWFFLFYYSYKKEYFNLERVKKLTIYNFVIFSCLIISLPTIVSLEFIRIGLEVNLIFILTSSLFLLFVFLKISESLSVKIKLKEKFIKNFKLFAFISWFSFTLLISYYIASTFIAEIELTPITLLILSCSFFTFFTLSIYSLFLFSSYSARLSYLKYFQDLIIYGIIISISFIFIFLILSVEFFVFLFTGPLLFNVSILIGSFFTIFLLILVIIDNIIEMRLSQLKIIIELISWLIIKILICVLVFSLFDFFAYQFFMINKIFLFSLIFLFLTPISLFILKSLKYLSTENQFLIKKIAVIIFIISILSIYSEILFNTMNLLPIFYQNFLFHITVFIVNLILFGYYFILIFNITVEERSVLKLFRFYILSFILFISLLYFGTILSIFLLLISFVIILSQRSSIPIFRFFSYFLLSFFTFIETIVILNTYDIIPGFDILLMNIFIILYLLSISGVLVFSIFFNIKRNNNLEKFSLYSLISLLSFVYLNSFTKILILYNITISAFILLLFIGINLYRQKDERYKWFINPCVLLFIFDFISFLSYSWFFNNPIFKLYNPILTFTLTLSMTGFGFILLYNKAPARFRKKSFLYVILPSIVFSFPTFLYFLIIAALSMPLWSVVPFIVSINFGVFLFYFSIGIYQWRISWAIWKSGWYTWNILPFVNFYIIYQSFTGIDVLTNSLQFGMFSVEGSLIISIIICSLFFLPVVYSKIKKYFSQIFFIIWGESLFLLYWISQNLFVDDIFLRNLSFILFSAILLMPILVGLKFWKILSILWVFPLTFVNIWFILSYLISIGISFELAFSIDVLVIGLLLIVYSFFPNIRSVVVVLITAYFITLLGIFLTIYFVLYSLILNPYFAINMSFITVGFSLFSSKYVKLSKRIIDICLSWILIINFAWLTFNTLSLIPGLIMVAFSLALTVLGFSFFIFNRYKMKIPINKAIPYLILTIGASLSASSLISIIFKASPGILISVSFSVFILFLYFLITEYRFIIWFLIPIPITSPIFEQIMRINFIKPFWLLTWSMLYLISFQILINLFKNLVTEEKPEIKNSILKLFTDKNQVKQLNFTCFLLNSISTSLFIAIFLPNLLKQIIFTELLLIYQICDFLIIWSFSFLICMKYVEKSELNIRIKNPMHYFAKISFILYLLIPFALGINLYLYLVFMKAEFLISLYLVLLLFSAVMFIENFFLDKNYFYLLFNSTRNQFTLGSWLIFSNILALFLYLFHLNVFLLILTISLLNIVSIYFLSHLDISKTKISTSYLILIYNSFIWSSFYIASLISDGLVFIFEELRGFTYYSLLFQNAFLLLFVFSYFFIKFEKNLKNWIEFIFFIIFQGLLGVNLILILVIYNYLNVLTINIIILIETCLSFKPINNVNIILPEQKYPNFLTKISSILVLLLYIEVSMTIYGLLIGFIGILESILISLSLLFFLTFADIYSIKKVRKSYASLVHSVSFFTISFMLFLIINRLVSQYPLLLSVEIFIFLIMQFYTNYSLFASLKNFSPNKKEDLKKVQLYIQHLLGIGFYLTLCSFILQSLILQRFELQLILLILSVVVHALMIIDNFLLKFIDKTSNYIKVISWIFIMTFTATYLIWLYSTYFITFFFTVIPIIIIILILEVAYLFRLLIFWPIIISKKEKIRFFLINLTYLNFITWPLYFARLNAFLMLNLILFSFLITVIIAYIDETIGVLREKTRKSLKSYSFLIFGGLLTIDVFILLGFIPHFDILLNVSISSLLFITFIVIKVKPFKEHSFIAFGFWMAIFLLLSLFIYRISLSWIFGVVVLGLTILIYPFVFLLEELRELFNRFIDNLINLFRMIKTIVRNLVINIVNFIKLYFKSILIIVNMFLSIFLGILLSPAILNILNWIHSILLIFPFFGLLYSFIPTKKSEDVDITFKRHMYRLIISWGSIIVVLFAFITPIWYIFTIWISIWIVGAILLPYISFKEKSENISIKWRFYTLILLIILLILFGILFGTQIYMNFFLN